MSSLDKLSGLTYAIQHNPNCPSPFLIRLVGKNRSIIDLKYYDETKDQLFFGLTLEETVEKVLAGKA